MNVVIITLILKSFWSKTALAVLPAIAKAIGLLLLRNPTDSWINVGLRQALHD